MKNIKTYLLIALVSILSFISGVTINSMNANPSPTEINYAGNIQYKRVYVDGRYFVVFWNSNGLAAVKEN